MAFRAWLGGFALVAVATGCGVTTSSPAQGAPDPSVSSERALVGDWSEPFELALPNGWTAGRCDEGSAPLICLRDGARLLGDLALSEYPQESLPDDDAQRVAFAHAEEFVRVFSADRAAGCPAFTFHADPVVAAQVGGIGGAKTAFALRDEDGQVVERVVVHMTAADGVLWLVHTDAYVREAGCLPPPEVEVAFAPADLVAFEALLDELVASTPLPEPAGAPG